jgi:hypothetical protein
VRISISHHVKRHQVPEKVHQKELLRVPFSGVVCEHVTQSAEDAERKKTPGPAIVQLLSLPKSRNDDGLTRSATYSATGEPRSKTVGDEFGNAKSADGAIYVSGVYVEEDPLSEGLLEPPFHYACPSWEQGPGVLSCRRGGLEWNGGVLLTDDESRL